MTARNVKIKSTKRGLLFTSAGGIRSGWVVSLPAAEATKLIGMGYAVKAIIRRKKADVAKDVDTGDAGGNGNIAAQQQITFVGDAQAAAVDGVRVENTRAPPCGNPDDDSGTG